jgi:hypothetical protein
LGSQGVAIASVVAPWATFLNYGPIAADGTVLAELQACTGSG